MSAGTPPPPWLPRKAMARLEEALDSSRVVALLGARQSGKSTLAREIARRRGGTYASLDDEDTRAAVSRDPSGFLQARAPLVIDEFQRAGDPLLRAVKRSVDDDATPGRFLLTGSTRYTTMPNLSESLAGRVEIVDLWPLSQGEIHRAGDGLVDRLFGPTQGLRRIHPEPASRDRTFERITAGGYPTAYARPARTRDRWYDAYLRTLTQRDVREFSRAQELEALPRLLRLLAGRTAQEFNAADVARDLGMPRTTLPTYLALLETVYLVHRLPAWSTNLTKKAVKHPKLHFVDAGLAAHLLGMGAAALSSPTSTVSGPLLETFVAGELARQLTWSEVSADLLHFRDRDGAEVDCILEARDGRIAGIEVKCSGTVTAGDFRGLDVLEDRLGSRFANGIVLHLGERTLPFGDHRTALPLAALWEA